jgi:signal transduction histidine kinase
MNNDDAWRLAEIGQRAAELVHQVRQPLFTARGLVQLAAADPARSPEHLADALTQLGVLESLLASWADLSRRPGEADEWFDLRAPVSAALVLLRHRASRNGVAILEEIGAAAAVKGSALAIQQAVANLGNTAIEALRPHGGTLRVACDGDGVVVEDDGPGMPEAVRERLFQPFVTTRDDGTGLGLVVARRMVERCGGTLSLEEVPVGVRWRIRFRGDSPP